MSRHSLDQKALAEKEILVVGGAGYIGSHMVLYLLERGYAPVVLDDLSTGHRHFVPRSLPFYEGAMDQKGLVDDILKRHRIKHVIHFAARALVAESVRDPLSYYVNNVAQTLSLLKDCVRYGVKSLVFSSTCATFGAPQQMPITEDSVQNPINPYGTSKLMVEHILRDLSATGSISCTALRYFNAAGAHESASIGEDHNPETHLIPNLLKAALGETGPVTVYGNDYPTPDGTCVRDYVHVMDLALAHELALWHLEQNPGFHHFNLGSGRGYSNLQVLKMVEQVTGREVPFVFGPRRPGDPPTLIADYKKAYHILGWAPTRSLEQIISSAYRWQVSRASRGNEPRTEHRHG